jgi:hypothetical protein
MKIDPKKIPLVKEKLHRLRSPGEDWRAVSNGSMLPVDYEDETLKVTVYENGTILVQPANEDFEAELAGMLADFVIPPKPFSRSGKSGSKGNTVPASTNEERESRQDNDEELEDAYQKAEWIVGFDEAKVASNEPQCLTTYAALAIRKNSLAHEEIKNLVTEDAKKTLKRNRGAEDMDRIFGKLKAIKGKHRSDCHIVVIAVPKYDLYVLSEHGVPHLPPGPSSTYVPNCKNGKGTLNEAKAVWCAYTLALLWAKLPPNQKKLLLIDDWNVGGDPAHVMVKKHLETLLHKHFLCAPGVDVPKSADCANIKESFCFSRPGAFEKSRREIASVVQACGYFSYGVDTQCDFSILHDKFSQDYATDYLKIVSAHGISRPVNGVAGKKKETSCITAKPSLSLSCSSRIAARPAVGRGDIYHGK